MHVTKLNERRGNAFERLLGETVWREKRKEKLCNYIVISKKLRSNKNICQISSAFDQNLLLYPITNYNLSNFPRAITSLLSFASFKKILPYISMRNSESLSFCQQKFFHFQILTAIQGLQNHMNLPNFRIKANFTYFSQL